MRCGEPVRKASPLLVIFSSYMWWVGLHSALAASAPRMHTSPAGIDSRPLRPRPGHATLAHRLAGHGPARWRPRVSHAEVREPGQHGQAVGAVRGALARSGHGRVEGGAHPRAAAVRRGRGLRREDDGDGAAARADGRRRVQAVGRAAGEGAEDGRVAAALREKASGEPCVMHWLRPTDTLLPSAVLWVAARGASVVSAAGLPPPVIATVTVIVSEPESVLRTASVLPENSGKSAPAMADGFAVDLLQCAVGQACAHELLVRGVDVCPAPCVDGGAHADLVDLV
jgi:hypothetical protein